MAQIVKLNMDDLRNIVNETIDCLINESKAKPGKQKVMYDNNKSAKCGETLKCPVCGSDFVKRQWQQAFCSGKCKERYWNTKGDRHKDPRYYSKYNMKHPERYLGMGVTRAEKDYFDALHAYATDPDFRAYMRDTALNSDGSWDSHEARNTIDAEYQNYLDDYIEDDFYSE